MLEVSPAEVFATTFKEVGLPRLARGTVHFTFGATFTMLEEPAEAQLQLEPEVPEKR